MKSSCFLALDIGSKFIGYAVCCGPVGSTREKAQSTSGAELMQQSAYIQEVGHTWECGAVLRAQNHALRVILSLLEQYAVSVLVVGYPYQESGRSSEQGEDILKFCRRISRRFNPEALLVTYLVDESFSSVEAEEKLGANSSEKRMRFKETGEIDAQAALIIGRRYLEDENKYRIEELQASALGE